MAMRSKTLKLDLHYVLSIHEKHLDMLPWEGDRSNQPLFAKFKAEVPPPGECFYLPGRLGIDRFRHLFRQAARSCGLDLPPLQETNQALRPTIMSLHKKLAINPTDTASITGHSSTKTQQLYQRTIMNDSATVNGIIHGAIEGTVIETPPDKYIKTSDGQLLEIRPLAKSRNGDKRNDLHFPLVFLEEKDL